MSADATRYASIDIDTSRPPRDRYQLIGHLGTSPFADIYLARMFTGPGGWQEFLFKQLRPGLQARPGFVDALADASIKSAALHHEGSAAIVEIGDLEGKFFVTTELVRGAPLRELHRRLVGLGDAVPMQFSLKVASDALEVLHHAHTYRDANGALSPIPHTNLTPENIIITYKGVTKLVDFGLGNAEIASSGRGLNASYAAPEQARGDLGDARSDLFALGLALYELVMNRLIDEDGSNLLRIIRSGVGLHEILEGAQLPPALAQILESALAADPRVRYQDASSMKEAIDAFQRERARAASQENLGRFVQDQFADRLRSEERARLNRDDLLLVKSMQFGGRTFSVPDSPGVRYPASADATVTPDMEIVIDEVDPEPSVVEPDPSEDEMTAPGLDQGSRDLPLVGGEPHDEPTSRERKQSAVRKRQRPKPRKPAASSQDENSGSLGRIGRYALIRRLGYGSMAEVFLARSDGDAEFKRLVAVKRILPHLATDKKFLEMFLAEARLAGRLTHPNVVQIYDFGSDDGQYYIAMEFVGGWDLATVLQQCGNREEHVPLEIALRIMSNVCAALHAGHTARDEQGKPMHIVHRDVAPQNILISLQGQVKLTDFGIAKANDSETQTRVGEIRGKPAYMAPERIVPDLNTPIGRPGDLMAMTSASERADIFSVGAVLFEVLTSQPLFRRETPFATLMAAQRDPIPPVSRLRPECPKALDFIVERAASRWPGERHASAHALQTDLERILEQFGGSVTPAQIAIWLQHLFASGSGDELSTDSGLRSDSEKGDEVRTALMHRSRLRDS